MIYIINVVITNIYRRQRITRRAIKNKYNVRLNTSKYVKVIYWKITKHVTPV